jgi:hypothetical protein
MVWLRAATAASALPRGAMTATAFFADVRTKGLVRGLSGVLSLVANNKLWSLTVTAGTYRDKFFNPGKSLPHDTVDGLPKNAVDPFVDR